MRTTFVMVLFLAMISPAFAQNGFKQQQLKFDRVKTAYDEKWETLHKFLVYEGFKSGFQLCLCAYKTEGKLELWLKNPEEQTYKLFRTYDFCEHSGSIGPKVKEGDGQTPEGFYHINVFNPQSSFYLSLGINYPNTVDLKRSGTQKPGGDIYIHGNCVTVGCIPLTDDKIKEVYALAVEARNGGQTEIPVTIFPFKMTPDNLKAKLLQYPQHKILWNELRKGYAYFEKYKILPAVTEQEGKYRIN